MSDTSTGSPQASGEAKVCDNCHGAGYTLEPDYYDDGQMSRSLSAYPCPKCAITPRTPQGGNNG